MENGCIYMEGILWIVGLKDFYKWHSINVSLSFLSSQIIYIDVLSVAFSRQRGGRDKLERQRANKRNDMASMNNM